MQKYSHFPLATITGMFLAMLVETGIGLAQPRPQSLGHLPLSFEQNGDAFVAHGAGYGVALSASGPSIRTFSGGADGQSVSAQFAGARHASAVPEAQLPGKVNYIFGNDPAKWKIGLPTWQKVRYSGIYPGIDVEYYGHQQQLEFDLVLKPGADPRRIRMKVGGSSGVSLDDHGDLLIGAAKIELPTIYQIVDGRREEVSGRFVIRGRDEVGVETGRYDRSKTLVIDPTILYSAMLSGGGSSVFSHGVAVDGTGNIVIAGDTYSDDFPTVNASQTVPGGGYDAFVSKINAAGDTLLYSTYLGGSGSDIAYGVAVDAAGSAWITGSTNSNNFPLLNAAQSSFGGYSAAFTAKLNGAGVLQFSTYLGGSINGDLGYAVAVDGSGNGYVTGAAGDSGSSFTTTSGALATGTAFVVKYAPGGSIVYSALLGGSGSDGGSGIAVDSSGNAYVTGSSSSSTFNAAPAGGAHSTNNAGMYNADVFVTKVNPAATNLLYFTFLGSTSTSAANGIAVDAGGNAWIVGTTHTPGLGTTGTGQTNISASGDGFVAQLNPTGSAFNWFTYLGGQRLDSVFGIALDGSGNAWVAGRTTSSDFPILQAVQPAIAGNSVSLLRSSDSGTSWAVGDAHLPGVAADISVNPSGASAVALTDSGIYRSTDGGNTWSLQSTYASYSTFGSAFIRSTANASTIYAFASDQFLVSTDDGVTWKIDFSVPAQAGIVDPTNPTMVYGYPGTSSSVLLKMSTGGGYYALSGAGLPFGTVQSMAATSDGTLYLSFEGPAGIYRSTDHGTTWTSFINGIATGDLTIVVSPKPGSLTASGMTVYYAGDQLYKLTSGSTAWVGLGNAVSAPILASAQDASVVYGLSADNTLAVSTDGGNTWSEGQTVPADLAYATTRIVADASSSTGMFLLPSVNTSGFVTKLNGSGAFVWSTFLGGVGASSAIGVAADTAGNAVVTGDGALGFPTTSTALPASTMSTIQSHAFVARIADPTAACALQVNASDQIVPATGGSLPFSVVAPSGCAWTTTADQTWVTVVEGSSRTGSGSVVARIPANTGANRTAVLTIGSTKINITQAGAGCVNTTDQNTYLVPSGGGTVSIVMTTGATCPWSVTYPSPTVTLTSAVSGTGSATITAQVAANVSSARYYYVSIGTAVVEISQGVSSAPIVEFFSGNYATAGAPYAGGALSGAGGSPPYGPFAITSGALPPGLSLNTATGAISGTATSSAGSPYSFSATVQDSNHHVSTPGAFSFTVYPGATITAINDGADLSAAPLAPGSLAQLTGTLLATSTATAGAGAAPFMLGGATVSVNGTAAAILSASATKIVFQVPYETAVGTATVTATANGSTSNGLQFGVVAAAPGVFCVLNGGIPVSPGGSATIYYTGAGAENPAVADGAVGPATPPLPAIPATVTIGGSNAAVTSQGLIPGLVGYSQTTVQVPGLIAGAYPVVVTANGRSSQPATMYVQGTAPAVTGIAPSSAPLGSTAVTVNIAGSNFGDGATVLWTPAAGTATVLTPTQITATQITAIIPASLLVSAGTPQIAVVNGIGVASGSVTFHIVPVITSVSPGRVTAGSGDTMVTIVGQGLQVGATLSFAPPAGTPVSIALSSVQSTQVTATIPAADLTNAGTAEVAVADSTGGLSNLLPLTITGAPGTTTVTLTSSAATSILGQPVSLTANVTPAAATGKITFYSGTTVLGTRSLSGGAAVFTTTLLPAGSQMVKARYSGDNTYAAGASVAMTQKVTTLPSNGWAAPVANISNAYTACIVTADFDGDGKPDLAACPAITSVGIVILKGNGDGTFQAPTLIPMNVAASSLLAADFNGDGKQDLGAVTPQGVYILMGNGNGSFGTPTLQTTTTATGVTTQAVSTADFNQDGIPDLVASNTDGSIVSLLGVGDGTFRMFSTPGATFTYGNRMMLAAGDFNGDGIPDFATPDITTYGFRVFLGKGDGSFQNPVVHAGNSGVSAYSLSISAGDLNGDGKTDLIICTDAGLFTALGNGDGTFVTAAARLFSSGANLTSVTDYNGDGNTDIVVVGSGGTVILLGDGAGNFPNSTTYAAGLSSQGSFVLGSFDGGGHVEAAESGYVSLWLDASAATPVANSVNPATGEAGDAATTVTVTGGKVGVGTNILWTGPDGAQTTLTIPNPSGAYITPGQVTVTAPMTLLVKPGTAKVALVNNLGAVSNALPFIISPFEITSVSGGAVAAGASHAAVTVNGPTASHAIGLLFTPPGGSPKTLGVATVGPTQVSATIPGAYLTVAGTAKVALIKSEGVTSNSLSWTIGQALQTPTVVLSSSGSPSLFGKPVTLTATLTPSTATGKVFFYDGATVVGGGPVVNGSASTTTILLMPGSHSIVARYTGDSSVATASSHPLAQSVTSVPTVGFGNPSGAFTTNGQGVAAGDFNGDGNADLAVANGTSTILTILLGKGDGTFQQPVSYNGTTGSFANGSPAIVVADLNGDGKSDIVIADMGGKNLSVFIGNGNGTFQPVVQYTSPTMAQSPQVLVADFNRDGIPDAVTISYAGYSFWPGVGDGTFGQATDVAFNDQLSAPAAGDFNNDGDADFVLLALPISPGYTSGFWEMLANGDGTFQQSTLFSQATTVGHSVLVADLNKDGIPDLVIGNQVAYGNGNGTFASPVSVTSASLYTVPLLATDLNGDGNVDLVESGASNNGANIYYGKSDGTFGPAQQPSITYFNNLAVADFNGDGMPDLASSYSLVLGLAGPAPVISSISPASAPVSSAATTVVIAGSNFAVGSQVRFVNGGTTSIIPTQLQANQITASIPASSLSQARTAQVTIVGANGLQSNTVPFYVTPFQISGVTPGSVIAGSQGVGVTIAGTGLTTAISMILTPSGGSAVTIPLNQIQATQVTATIPAMFLRAAGSVQVALANSAGTLSNPVSFTITAPLSASTVSVMTSGSPATLGQPVTLTATITPASATGKVTFYSGTRVLGTRAVAGGTATFVTRLLPTGTQSIRAHYSGDASNGPGNAAPVSQTIQSNASAGLQTPVAYGSGGNVADMAVGDFNNDGIADIATVNQNSSGLSILTGDGNGAFHQTASYTVSSSPVSVKVADFDGDGNADIVVLTGSILIFKGNGDGTFQAPYTYAPACCSSSSYFRSVAVADVDGDGVPDVVAGLGDGTVVIFTGNGDGTLSPVSSFGTVSSNVSPLPILTDDFNGDGVVDIVYADGGFIRTFLGNGDGTFGNPIAGPASGAWLISGDFNGDGKPDLATGTLTFPFIQGTTVALGNGDGTFTLQPTLISSGLYTSNAVAGDFYGDGKTDLAVATGNTYILHGNGDGTFGRQAIDVIANEGPALAVADFNGDGVEDLATGLSTAGVAVQLGEAGAAPVITSVTPSYGLVNSSGVAITISGQNLGKTAYVNWAQTSPIVPSQVQSNQVTVTIPGSLFTYPTSVQIYLTDTAGVTSNALPFSIANFAITSVTPSSAPAGSQAVQVTITGTNMSVSANERLILQLPNGAQEQLSLTNQQATQATGIIPAAFLTSPGVIYLSLSNDTGSNSLPFTILPALTGPSVTVSSSLNPAGQSQAVTLTASISPGSATGTVIFYDGITAIGRATVAGGQASVTTGLLAGGKHSITARYLGDSQNGPVVSPVFNQVVTATPSNGFLPSINYVAGTTQTNLAMADLNHDGIADLIIAGMPASISVMIGNSDGSFHSPVSYPIYGAGASALVTTDFDGDGITDVMAVLNDSYGMEFLKGNGDGTLQSAVFIGAGSTSGNTQGGTGADFNGDGVPDVISGYEGRLATLLGLGNGTFEPAIVTTSLGVVAAAGDFNGDGKVDFVAGESNPANLIHIFRGNGDGTFQTAISYTADSSAAAKSIATGDFNNDGNLDFAFADGTGVWMALGKGDATFTLSSIAGVGNSPQAVTACDFDGDRKPDLCIADGSVANGGAIVLRGNGDGTFGAPLVFGTGIPAIGIVAGDFNRDGQTDLALIDQGDYAVSVLLGAPGSQPQTITFGALSNVTTGTAPILLTASASSGLPVRYVSNTSGVCTVSGSTVAIVTAGGCSITASQSGNATYAEASATQTFTVMFGDIAPTDHYYAAINALAQRGITSGCGSNDFCAGENVTRDEMAIFIVRAIYGNDNFVYSPTPYFTDVQPETFGFKWIQKMKELGITSGCTATTYCPSGTVSRDQMAVFIIRARLGLALAGGTNPTFTYPSTPYFTDVPAGAFGYQWIQRMKEENITSGCTATTYCASDPIIRGDMAIFIMRGEFNQFLPAGTPVIAQISPSTLALGASGTYTITGLNTNFVQGTTTISPIPGVAIGTVTVNSPTSLTVQLTAASNAVAQPYSILAITGAEEAVLPNGLVLQ